MDAGLSRFRARSRVAAIKALLLTAALTVAVTLFASHANASVSQGFISGAGTLTDDWGDEGELSRTTFPNSNAAGLWQKVLIADGQLSASQFDCRFGQVTEAATRVWQRNHNVHVDGKVGPQTFGAADNQLRATSDPEVIEYRGTSTSEFFIRSGGRYEVNPGVVAFYRTLSANC